MARVPVMLRQAVAPLDAPGQYGLTLLVTVVAGF
jgi:hypothetical protein